VALFKTLGVVIRKQDLGEADRLLTVFTRRFGKLKAVAKGSRRPRSRLGGHVEMLNSAEFMLWRREGRDLAVVSGAQMVEHFRVLRESYPAFAAAMFAAELIDRSLAEDDPQPRLFVYLIDFLRSLAHSKRPDFCLLRLMMRAVDSLGYAFSMVRCGDCDEYLPECPAALMLDYAEGVLCRKCAAGSSRPGEGLSAGMISAMRAATGDTPGAPEPVACLAAVRALDRALSYHQDRRGLRSEAMLESMVAHS